MDMRGKEWMNRTRYIPFERNRYFYGKLLTVRDFMAEQTYLADKRRLTNRLLFGSGVVAGLQVVAVDDKTISVETGVAIDQLGREIVVPSPLTLKLSNIDGFTHNDYAKNVYLCIAYDEKGKEPVHTAVGASGRNEEVTEYNRTLESYRLFITEQPPAPRWQEYDHLIEDTSIWYDDGYVRILQSVPRFVEPGEVFELRLTVEKTVQTPHIEFEYAPAWADLEEAEPLADGKIRFAEPTDGGQTVYTRAFRLRARELPQGETRKLADISARSGSARLVIGDKLIEDLPHVKQTIEISEEPAEERIIRQYYARSLDRALEFPAEPCVFLARIHLLQLGATYVIDRLESLPFKDYVINPSMFYKLMARRPRTPAVVQTVSAAAEQPQEAPAEFPDLKEEFASILSEDEAKAPEERVSTGIAEIDIVPPKKAKWYHRRQRNFYSDEIEHGLGEGVVILTAALSDEQEESDVLMPEMWNRSDTIYHGALEVFRGSELEAKFPKLSIGFLQYPKKGTFRIGVRVHKKTDRTKVRIRWWAVKPDADRSGAERSAFDQWASGEAEAAAAKT
jgi:hypothetical protein